ncbi:MAG: Uma2 family endonuclease [Gemmataceae bacterium]|nr:Uma2 family endonuclease [Gemmataceae bacterium]
MATATLKKTTRPLGPECNGFLLTACEFDRADFINGWRYELLNGVLIVTPIPSDGEVDPNEELGHWLRNYRERHPEGLALDATLPERYVFLGDNRRRADRVLWTGLRRMPRRRETPSIVAEFVSRRRRDQLRDYKTKRDEYLEAGVKEYWVINRFQRIMTVFTRKAGKIHPRVIRADQIYRPNLLPGFELPLAKLLAQADRWPDEERDDA